MKVKTSELTGAALDWAVARCDEGEELAEGWHPHIVLHKGQRMLRAEPYAPSSDWAQGGPIIEREGLLIRPQPCEFWDSWKSGADEPHYTVGHTPLIAAMRCYVACKLGETVDVPDELI